MENKTVKLSISSELEQAMDQAVEKVNAGFNGGKVDKLDFATWAISKVLGDIDQHIDQIRQAHFDHLFYLENAVEALKIRKKAGENVTREEIETTLRQGQLVPLKKRGRPSKSSQRPVKVEPAL